MKMLLASLALIANSAFAINSNILQGNVNLTQIVNATGKAMGIKGLLPVSVSGTVLDVALKFNGYAEYTTCLEYGEEEIPSHPETAPCLRYETKWVPQVLLMASKVETTLSVGEVTKKQSLPSYLKVPESCIENLKEETVTGSAKPVHAPAVLRMKSYCTAYAYSRIEEKLRPSALKGEMMEAVVDVTLSLDIETADVEVYGEGLTPVKMNALFAQPGTMGDFGGYRTKIFQYFDRVTLQ